MSSASRNVRQPGALTDPSLTRLTGAAAGSITASHAFSQQPHSDGVPFPIDSHEWTDISTRLKLSMREGQIARLLLEDLRETEIAALLSVSPRTVHGHLERLFQKLHIHSRHQLLIRLFKTYIVAHRATVSGPDRAA